MYIIDKKKKKKSKEQEILFEIGQKYTADDIPRAFGLRNWKLLNGFWTVFHLFRNKVENEKRKEGRFESGAREQKKKQN